MVLQPYDINSDELEMSQAREESNHAVFTTQEIALHMMASAARVLLMVGTAVLLGELAAGPARRLIAARHQDRAAAVAASTTES